MPARRRIAVARATNPVLLGDPQQLAHVSQGMHPVGTGASVLEHLLGDHDTVRPDRGVLRATSRPPPPTRRPSRPSKD